MKNDDLSLDHLRWAVKSRAATQEATLELFELFKKYPEILKGKEFLQLAQSFAAISFSLWRAAFLADKTGMRTAVLEDARNFLGKMLVDNAINYQQDRSAREWTFNYYMNNARDGLVYLSKRWPDVATVLNAKKRPPKETTAPQRRWDRHQGAFKKAIACLARDLSARVSN